jgi:hypothetical protein
VQQFKKVSNVHPFFLNDFQNMLVKINSTDAEVSKRGKASVLGLCASRVVAHHGFICLGKSSGCTQSFDTFVFLNLPYWVSL